MSELLEILAEVESTGAALQLEGDILRIRYQDSLQREQLSPKVSFLRAHRGELTEWLRVRVGAPPMPAGVRLLKWNLKQPPVAIDICSVVTDSARFARTTLEQLRIALAEPGRWVGWTTLQLIDRLHQVGVDVALEAVGKLAP